jgi:hypothetical protein
MPTLAEAWLAEQTAERLPWQHPKMAECPAGASVEKAERGSLDLAKFWLERRRLAVRVPEPVPVTGDHPSSVCLSDRVR